MTAAASCRSFMYAVAKKLQLLHYFDYKDEGPMLGDVLRAKHGVEGEDWSTEVAMRTHTRVNDDGSTTRIKSVRLLDFFTVDKWTKLNEFNDVVTSLKHDGVLPAHRMGLSLPILPHSIYNDDMIKFLQTIEIKASLFPFKSWLEVKERVVVLSEGSSESE